MKYRKLEKSQPHNGKRMQTRDCATYNVLNVGDGCGQLVEKKKTSDVE